MVVGSKKVVVVALFLACVLVLSQWGIFTKGIFSLGLNTVIAGGLFWYLLFISSDTKLSKSDIAWYLPLWLILTSFILFENPWLKLLSIPLLPIFTGVVYSFRQIRNCDDLSWDVRLLDKLIMRTISPIRYLSDARYCIAFYFKPSHSKLYHNMLIRVLTGAAILTILASLVLVLLSSADAKFAELVAGIFNSFWRGLNVEIAFKLIAIGGVAILIIAILLAWQTQGKPIEERERKENLDDVVSGIVIGGILAIYVTFLFLQLEYLIIGELPADFSETEKIVKSGFWQLFFLSAINAVMFFILYKRTSKFVEILLRAFIFLSSLLVLSAFWRLGLYIYWYGLSHEKFFAGYTSLFALFMFTFLTGASFLSKRVDIFKLIVFSSLWFYAVAGLLPVERIIFKSNLYLSVQDDTRVDLHHLTHMSIDVMNDVQENLKTGKLKHQSWQGWLSENYAMSCKGKWYETNFSRLLYCRDDYLQTKLVIRD